MHTVASGECISVSLNGNQNPGTATEAELVDSLLPVGRMFAERTAICSGT